MSRRLALIPALLFLFGCPTEGPVDADADGISPPEDCDDQSASVFPGNGEQCDGVDNDCDGTIDEGFDEDADGFNTCGADRDCDDVDATVHPGAAELCDTLDNNCDGTVDEGCDPIEDGDGDGYFPPEDCDDGNAAIHPGVTESCNGLDDNCDGAIDEGFDLDGDGYSYCGDVDCDDSDPAIHPDAAEVCDGDDEDCDGLIDEDFDADSDGWTTCHDPADCNDAVASIHPLAPEQCNGIDDDCDSAIDEDTDDDVDGDGISACNGDCDDSNPDVFPGAVELPNGLDDDCNGVIDDGLSGVVSAGLFEPQVTGTATQARLGDVLSTGGFFDSDSYADVVAGAGSHNGGQGRAYLVLGESFALSSPPAAVTPFATVTGAEVGDYLGASVDLGDIDGDGFDDMIIGSPELGSVDPPKGTVYIFFGSPVLSSGEYPPSSADVIITGGFPTEQCGTAVAALGDVNGDGLGDLGFTCPWYNPGDGNLRGRTVIFFGRATWSATYTSDDADAAFIGDVEDSESGQTLVGDFDANGDGYADIAIGSPNWSSGVGRAGLALGRPTAEWPAETAFGSMDRLWVGNVDHRVGDAMSRGDANGDEFDDLVIAGTNYAGEYGLVGVLFGQSSVPPSGYLWGTTQFYVAGAAPTEQAGYSSALTDADGDGVQDLLIATPGFDGAGGGDQGRVTYFYGPLESMSGAWSSVDGDAFILGEAGGDFLGGAMTVVPDFNGDGADDVLLSAPFNDAGGGNAGRIYFVPGL